MIYFIQQGTDGPVKIGWTGNLVDRLGTLQVGNPQTLHVIGLIAGRRREEAAIQKLFEHNWIRGEWHTWTPELQAYIADLPAAGRDSFLQATAACAACGSTSFLVLRQERELTFTSTCKRCLMAADGRTLRLVARNRSRPPAADRSCVNCSKVCRLKRSECSACYQYRLKHRDARPQHLFMPRLPMEERSRPSGVS